MRICVQRVSQARVKLVETGEITGEIGCGLLVLLGIGVSDTEKEAVALAKKIATLRIFEDENGKMNRSVFEVGGKMLVVSQFTLYADCRKGRRPGFSESARPEHAIPLYRCFLEEVRKEGIEVAEGRFQQSMHVELTNDGPVTIWIDSDSLSIPREGYTSPRHKPLENIVATRNAAQ